MRAGRRHGRSRSLLAQPELGPEAVAATARGALQRWDMRRQLRRRLAQDGRFADRAAWRRQRAGLVTRRDVGAGADLYAAAARALSDGPGRAGPAQARDRSRSTRSRSGFRTARRSWSSATRLENRLAPTDRTFLAESRRHCCRKVCSLRRFRLTVKQFSAIRPGTEVGMVSGGRRRSAAGAGFDRR